MARLAALLLFACVAAGLAVVLYLSAEHTAAINTVSNVPLNNVTITAPLEGASSRDIEGGPLNDTRAASTLQRDEPRKPLSTLAAPILPAPPLDPDKLPRRWRMIHQAVATAAGILDVDGMTIVLPGIDVVAVDETCVTRSGDRWPCGMAARTAFRAYLRGRAMNCHVPDARLDTTILTECLLQGEDPSLWLVRNGWARAKATSPFVLTEESARVAAVGIYGAPPR